MSSGAEPTNLIPPFTKFFSDDPFSLFAYGRRPCSYGQLVPLPDYAEYRIKRQPFEVVNYLLGLGSLLGFYTVNSFENLGQIREIKNTFLKTPYLIAYKKLFNSLNI